MATCEYLNSFYLFVHINVFVEIVWQIHTSWSLICMSQAKVINKRNMMPRCPDAQMPMFSPWYFVPQMPDLLVSTWAVYLRGIGWYWPGVDLLLGGNSWTREDSLRALPLQIPGSEPQAPSASSHLSPRSPSPWVWNLSQSLSTLSWVQPI